MDLATSDRYPAGVVTQLGIHLAPAPEYYMSCEISVGKEEDLPFLVGTLSDLIRRNIITNSPSIEISSGKSWSARTLTLSNWLARTTARITTYHTQS